MDVLVGMGKYLFLIISWTFFSTGFSQIQEPKSIVLDDLLTLMAKNDDTIRVFNFWATWCAPCIKEWPYFQKLSENSSDKKLKLWMISLDDARKLKSKVVPFLQKHQYTASVLLLNETRPNVFIDAIEPAWLGAIPATLIIYKGKRCFAEKEFHSQAELNDWIENCTNFKN
ncbi:MAG: TlpA family protein disulfide reductase [Saprospiraceae bacterium]|nr:TlpA family protein disulfide reductase [Saprospiraceae bacterium]MBK7812517.1 TlpA family protein disulfide reductase [Saprospiraceae bacterium]MBK9631990.1 TlpA family protein disulfide reductase [Saprospiraceae bacterium]